MNHFFVFKKPTGKVELTTPPLSSGLILPGVTRMSVLELASAEWPQVEVTQRRVTMGEVMAGLEDGRLVEMFGTGTAGVVSPVGGLYYKGKLHRVPTVRGKNKIYCTLYNLGLSLGVGTGVWINGRRSRILVWLYEMSQIKVYWLVGHWRTTLTDTLCFLSPLLVDFDSDCRSKCLLKSL